MRKIEQVEITETILEYLKKEKDYYEYFYMEERAKALELAIKHINFLLKERKIHPEKSDIALSYIAGVEDENRRLKFIVNQLGLEKELKGYL